MKQERSRLVWGVALGFAIAVLAGTVTNQMAAKPNCIAMWEKSNDRYAVVVGWSNGRIEAATMEQRGNGRYEVPHQWFRID